MERLRGAEQAVSQVSATPVFRIRYSILRKPNAGHRTPFNRYNSHMFHVALWEPEIPPNTGNVARLCAATGAVLHLVGRLGFRLDDRHLLRAGLDYWSHADVRRHNSLEEMTATLPESRIIPVSSKVSRPYTQERFQNGDCLLFGSESKGLPPSVLARYAENAVTIPMPAGHVRSLNLATAVSIVLYEALRQLHNW
jgi:tRNA (cytidine/uridine-2'-O-)-methyltransferase